MAARPWKVRDLDAYLEWFAEALEQTGGVLDDPGYLLTEDFTDDYGSLVDVLIRQQELVFYDGTRLAFRVRVTHEGVVEDYRYHLMDAVGNGLCRLDKHPGHEEEVGGLTHMHIGPVIEEGLPLPAEEYDVDDAIAFLRDRCGGVEPAGPVR